MSAAKKKRKVIYHKDDPTLFTAPKTIRACVLAWCFPGLGHWTLGRHKAAAFIGGAILLAILMGAIQGGDLYPFSGEGKIRSIGAFCQMGFGLPYLLLKLILERGEPLNLTYDYGTIYFLVAGMLNWLAILDTFDIAVKRK